MKVDYQAVGADPDGYIDNLGGKAKLYGTFTAPVVELHGNAQKDDLLLDVDALNGDTFVFGGAGNDKVTVNRLPSMVTNLGLVVNGPFAKDGTGREIRDELTIDGQDGSDLVLINIEGSTSDYVINVVDTGSKLDGEDVLQVEGTSAGDVFLMRGRDRQPSQNGDGRLCRCVRTHQLHRRPQRSRHRQRQCRQGRVLLRRQLGDHDRRWRH